MKNILHTLLIISGVFLSGPIHAMKRNASHLDTNTENQTQKALWLPGEVIDHIAGDCQPTEKDLLMKVSKDFYARLKDKESIMLANPATVTLSHKIKKMFEYTNSGDVKKLSIWLSTLNADDVNQRNNEGFTPLDIASQNGHTEVVQLLLNASAHVDYIDLTALGLITALTIVKHTPLKLASKNGHAKVVQLLLDAGAVVNPRYHIFGLTLEVGFTPLHYASENGHTEVVQLLLDADADVNHTNIFGYSPLHAALENKNPRIKIIKLLINHGANIYQKLFDPFNNTKCTPLEIAQRKGFTEIAKLILETHETNIVNSFLDF